MLAHVNSLAASHSGAIGAGARPQRPLSQVMAFAAALAALAATGGARADSSCTVALEPLCADQANLLSPFASLLNSPAGLAVLDANMQTEEAIYADPTGTGNASANAARRTLAAENALIDQAPQSILIGAFPSNANFTFDAFGVPTVNTAIPTDFSNAVSVVTSKMATGATNGDLKDYFGGIDPYGIAYSAPTADINGDPRPFQTSSAIAANPFTPANSSAIAYEIQQTGGNAETSGDPQDWLNYVSSPSFPSGHSAIGNANAIMFAILAPGYYQQFLQSGVDFGYSRNVFAAHYPLDVIGGRILATYVTAEILAGENPLYDGTSLDLNKNPKALDGLKTEIQGYLAGAGLTSGGASPYATACSNLKTCLGDGTIPTAAAFAQAARNYAYYLTYGLPSLGPTDLPPVVPPDAHVLLESRFPYLSVDQLNQVLASTELPSGGALDNGTGWARLNLYAAAGGYGAFDGNVTVDMDAAKGGFSAFDVWSNNISGPGGLTKLGAGTLILAGDDTYSGGTFVQGGTLGVTGSLVGPLAVSSGAEFMLGATGTFSGAVTNEGSVVNQGAMSGRFAGSGSFANYGFLSGVGEFGSLESFAGSTLAPGVPGVSIGTMRVAGDFTATGTTYWVQIAGADAGAISVGGKATVSGGSVAVGVIGADAELGHAYPILAATGGVKGEFASVSGDLLFLTPSLSQPDADEVFLTLTRNGVRLASVAATPNQAATANAIDAGPSSGALVGAVASQSAAGARQAFDALSGEVYASARTAMLNDSAIAREALLDRMRQAGFADDGGPAVGLATGGPMTRAYPQGADATTAPALAYSGAEPLAFPLKGAPAAIPTLAVWAQGVGSWERFGGDGNAAGASSAIGGLFGGFDLRLGRDWLVGVAGGYTDASVSVGERSSSADIGAAHLAAYTAAAFGPWNLRAGAIGSFAAIDAKRSIVFPGFADATTAHYGADMAQAFGEAGYRMTFGAVAAEPFGGLAFAHLSADGFGESGGGAAALDGTSGDSDIGFSTLGGRAAVDWPLVDDMTLTPHVSLAWQRALGALAPKETLTFQSTGETFSVAGLPLARDTALVEAGLDLRLGPQALVGLRYSGQFADRLHNNAIQGEFAWRF